MQSAVREESYGSVRVFWLDRDLVLSRLRESLRSLHDSRTVRRVVMFGSIPQKRAIPGSDLDLLIELDHDDRRFIDRIPEFLGRFGEIGISVDIFPYTTDELGSPLAVQALREGEVVYERESGVLLP